MLRTILPTLLCTAATLSAHALEGTAVANDTTGYIHGQWSMEGDLVVIDCATLQKTTIVTGSCYGACFSPDGSRIAYFKDGTSLRICNVDGTADRLVTSNTGSSTSGTPCANWIADDWIYWASGHNLKRVKINGTQRDDNVHVSSVHELNSCHVSHDGTRGAFTCRVDDVVSVGKFVVGGVTEVYGQGCGSSVSPDGTLITRNRNHWQYQIHNFDDWSVAKDLQINGGDVNQHAFSHLSNEYVCVTLDGTRGFIQDINTAQSWELGTSFRMWDYNPGDTPPPPQDVSILSFASDATWIETGQSATLTWQTANATAAAISDVGTVDVNGSVQVSPTEDTTYTLTADGQCGPVTAQVSVFVSSGPIPDHIDITPATATVASDQTLSLTAAARDAANQVIAAPLTWSVTGGDVSPADGTSTTFTPPGAGTFTVTVSAAGVTGTATVTVTVPPSITIHEPAGGEVWHVGTTRHIRWSTTVIGNVAVSYTTDGGSNAESIDYSVLQTQAEWGDLPWEITGSAPHLPSGTCQISIVGYFGECPTLSGVFEVRQIVDADGDGMDDGWETDVFGDLAHDETTDADADGTSDYDEFMNGGDPLVDENPGFTGASVLSCLPTETVPRNDVAGFLTLVLALLLIARSASSGARGERKRPRLEE